MTDWPVTLPDFALVDGYGERGREGSIRSKNDTGVDKVRPRFTAAPKNINIAISCTSEQAEIFESFYDDTLKFGALSFDWKHPRTQAPATMRIKTTPEYEPRGMGWTIKFGIEILP